MENSEARGWFIGSILVIAAIALLVVGAWQIGWIFTEKDEERQGKIENIRAHNLRKGYEYQQTLRGQISSDIEGIVRIQAQMTGQAKGEQEALANQRLAQLSSLCSESTQVSGEPLPVSQQKFISENCSAGAVNPNSPYEKGIEVK